MTRKPEDDCLICITNKATKTGSHFVPANMIAPCVNKRTEEESFDIDIANGGIDTFFGRANKKNNEHGLITDKKKNHYMYDYIFCPTCEKQLGVLEGKLSDDLMVYLRDPKYKNRYWHGENEMGQHAKKFLKVSNIDFLVLFFSIVLRYDIVFQIKHETKLLPDDKFEKTRKVVDEYLKIGDIIDTIDEASFFHFHLLTKYNFVKVDPTFILTSNNWDEPNIFFLCQFILIWHSATDKKIDKPNPFHNIVNSITSDEPIIAIVHDKVWDMMIGKIVQFKDEFMLRIGEEFCKINERSLDENIIEFQTLIKDMREKDTEKVDLNYTEQAKATMLKKYGREH